MTDFDGGLIIAAWLTGLAGGSGHCIGMCGGILGALAMGRQSGTRGRPRGWVILAAAHAGRILGYAVAGASVAALGASILHALAGSHALLLMRLAAALIVLTIGLQLLLGRPLLARLERGGARLWRRLGPVFRSLLPPRDPLHGLIAGMLWGWLPCGLVYAELAVAATAGGAARGALVMIAFGAGTSVSLSLVSVALRSLGLARLPRVASGVLLIAFAAWIALPLLQDAHGLH